MALKLDANTSATAYHVENGPQVFPYAIDAHSAVSRFPDEWSFTAWASDGSKSVPVVEIDPDWQDGKPSERIALAIKLGSERKGLTSAKADEVIEAEVERRATAAAPV